MDDDSVDTSVDYSGPDYIPQSTFTSNSNEDPLADLYGQRVTYSSGASSVLNSDGSTTYTDPDGSVYTVTPSGNYVTEQGGKTYTYDPKQQGFVDSSGKLIPESGSYGDLLAKLSTAVKNNPMAAFTTAAGALKAASGGNKVNPVGWQGTIPVDNKLVRGRINYNDPYRRPGEGGREYFTSPIYTTPANTAAAVAQAQSEASGIASGFTPSAAPTSKFNETNPAMVMPWNKRTAAAAPAAPAAGIAALPAVPQAQTFAAGGQPRYLKGHTDGMADKIPSTIDGKQKAALSHGEFVIPADVVSHLGNGNSDAGAQKLYQMMAKVRQARTGNPNQGKRINPNKFMPGGEVGYAEGGDVQGYADGGVTTPAGVTSAAPLGTSSSTNLSTWAGPYVADYLSKGAAVANSPYQAYKGPLTAGPSDLQQQQFAGIQSLAATGYDPNQFSSGTWDTNTASRYMNPYLSAALDPQIKEIQRQAQVQNLQNQAQATKQGAFGGSGSVLMKTEGQRNALDKIQQALGQGYKSAYDTAQTAYNTDAQRALEAQKAGEASRQFSADFGLKTLADLGTAGATQRDIAQQGITADMRQFEEQRDYPAKMVQYQKDLLQGLPITTTQTTANQTDISNLTNQINGLYTLYNTLSALGQTKTP